MSETLKMTKEQLLEVFKAEYKSIARRYERDVERYKLEMNKDYEYFFRWYADDLYKATVNLEAIRSMRELAFWDDIEKVSKWLENHISNLELNLLEGTITPTSTNVMVNTAGMLRRVAMQELRADLQRLYWIFKDK